LLFYIFFESGEVTKKQKKQKLEYSTTQKVEYSTTSLTLLTTKKLFLIISLCITFFIIF